MRKHLALNILLILQTIVLFQLFAFADTITITNVTVMDGSDAATKPNMTVIITGDRISSIQQTKDQKFQANVIDGTGKFLIPGLWDMHAHLTNYSEIACPALVANGVTGIRDLGGNLDLIDWMRERVANGKLVAPNIFRAGPFVDGSKPGVADRLVVWNASDARDAVHFLKKRGVDFIKTHTGTPREAYFALLDEAQKEGIKVVGHIPMEIDPVEAIDAGQYSIEHVVTLFESPFAKIVKSGKSQEDAMKEFPDEYFVTLARRMVSKKTWFDPTLIAYWNRSYQWDIRERKDPRERYISASAKEFWKVFPDLPPDKRTLLAKAYERFSRITAIMKKEGVRFLVGTDLGGKYSLPGFNVHDELELLVKAGLTPQEALQAATRNCAESLGILSRTGTIEVGKSADLVLLNSSPLENIKNTKDIFAVIRNGQVLHRADLDALLEKVAADAPTH